MYVPVTSEIGRRRATLTSLEMLTAPCCILVW